LEASESDYHVIPLSVITLSGFNCSTKQTLKAKETDFTSQIPIIPMRLTHILQFLLGQNPTAKRPNFLSDLTQSFDQLNYIFMFQNLPK
jgi:hypothetical protein